MSNPSARQRIRYKEDTTGLGGVGTNSTPPPFHQQKEPPMGDETDPTEAEVRLTALQYAMDLAHLNPEPTAVTVLASAKAFAAFLKGEDTNVRAN